MYDYYSESSDTLLMTISFKTRTSFLNCQLPREIMNTSLKTWPTLKHSYLGDLCGLGFILCSVRKLKPRAWHGYSKFGKRSNYYNVTAYAFSKLFIIALQIHLNACVIILKEQYIVKRLTTSVSFAYKLIISMTC